MSDSPEIKSEDRVLLIINDNTIAGDTRFQKYGFLLYKQYVRELAKLGRSQPNLIFYDDWKSHYYGPYSEKLDKDIKSNVEMGMLKAIPSGVKKNYNRYELTVKGRKKWRILLNNSPNEIISINDKIRNLQTTKLIELMRQIYNAYPEYTTKSLIKNDL